MTEENKRKEAAKRYAEKKAAMKEVVKKYLETKPAMPENVKEAVAYLAGVGGRSSRTTVNTELRKLFLDKKNVSEIEIFQKYSYGRPTMAQKIRHFINADPSERIWVALEGSNYVLKGTGANPPMNWKGYVPVKKADL